MYGKPEVSRQQRAGKRTLDPSAAAHHIQYTEAKTATSRAMVATLGSDCVRVGYVYAVERGEGESSVALTPDAAREFAAQILPAAALADAMGRLPGSGAP
jgi:hypothetical protein